MRKRTLVILSLIAVLALGGYALVRGEVAEENGEEEVAEEVMIAEEEGDEETEEVEEEVGKAEDRFEKLFDRLEKMELNIERKAPMSLIVTSHKKATLVNVELEAIEGETLTVGIFGLDFTVDASEAKIYGGGKQIELSDLEVGDRLLIKGEVDEETGVIKATRIHDRSVHRQAILNIRELIESIKERIEAFRARMRALRGE